MIRVFIETGKKKTFAGAVDWPGWCRSGKDEAAATQALVDYGLRYQFALQNSGTDFHPPLQKSELKVIERLEGDATTDFGAPAILLAADREAMDPSDCERFSAILSACWQVFDLAVQRAANRKLRKGPRGGGRSLDEIIRHVLEAERAYLKRLAWKSANEIERNLGEQLEQTRKEILLALPAAARGELPDQSPRGGKIWPPRFFIRRVAWHVLDHAWEIEDRVE